MCPHTHCYLLASGDRPSYRVNLTAVKNDRNSWAALISAPVPLAHTLAHQLTEERGMLFF